VETSKGSTRILSHFGREFIVVAVGLARMMLEHAQKWSCTFCLEIELKKPPNERKLGKRDQAGE